MKAFWWGIIFWLLMPGTILAGDLDGSVIRLSRNQTGESPLPILVLVKTKTPAVEDGLRIEVGSGFEIDDNVAVSVSGLPLGVTPLPSISNGVNGSGQIVDFTGGDLVAGVDYGFYITGGLGENPSVGEYVWMIKTLAGGVESDMMKIKVPIIAYDQVAITGKVGALASDFQLGLTADKAGDLSEDEVVTYEINYGSYLVNSTKPMVISAQWSRGTVVGSSTPSVDIVDYVVGSGTAAYGEVAPVIDLVNRKISWTINSFPANTINQKVSFQLKVNGSYTGQSRVKFEVEAILNGANVVTINSIVESYFLPALTPTAVITVAPTGITTPSVTSSLSTPAILYKDLMINKISIETLSDTKVRIRVESSLAPSELKIHYGLSSNNLNKTIVSANKLAIDSVGIDNLLANSDYYFRIEAITAEGKSLFSDLYTFKTASSAEGSEIDSGSLIVSIDNNVILDASVEKDSLNSIVVVPNKDYALRINIKKNELVKLAQIYIRDSQVLGINSVYGAEPNSTGVDLLEDFNGGFVGHLVSPTKIGFYDVILRVENNNGLISENRVGVLRVINHFTVKDSHLKGIENAKVTLYRYVPRQQIYELLPQQSLGFKNPSFTETDGTLNFYLPKGKYRVEVSAIGFENNQSEFVIGLGEEEVLPTIILKKTKMTLSNWWNYHLGTGSDVLVYSKNFFDNLIDSTRFFKLVNMGIVVSLVLVAYGYFTRRLKTYWWLLPLNILYLVRNLFKKRENDVTWGKVVDKNSGLPIWGAKVVLFDGKLSKIMLTKLTDKLGNFEFKVETRKSYGLTVVKEGFGATSLMDYSQEGLMAGNIVIKLENILTTGEKIEIFASKIGRKVVFGLGIFWLVILLGLEILFWKKYGFSVVWIWIALSCLNILGWLKR